MLLWHLLVVFVSLVCGWSLLLFVVSSGVAIVRIGRWESEGDGMVWDRERGDGV